MMPLLNMLRPESESGYCRPVSMDDDDGGTPRRMWPLPCTCRRTCDGTVKGDASIKVT